MAKLDTARDKIESSDQAIDRLYNHASLESKSYEGEIAKYQDKTSPSQVQDHSGITKISLRNLGDLLKNAAAEIGVPLKEQDNSKDGAVSNEDMRKIFKYSESRLKEYEENYTKLKSDPVEERKFHISTIVSLDDRIREARKNAAEFIKDGKAGQIEVNNNNPNTGNVVMANGNSGFEDIRNADSVIPTATQAGTGTGNAANASSKAMALPDKDGNIQEAKKKEEPNRSESLLNSLLAAIGFRGQEERDNAGKTLREKGDANGGSISQQDVAATFKNVTGRDINGLDPATLRQATQDAMIINKSGTVMHNDGAMKYAGTGQQRTPEQGLTA